jgi:hypothetical protein
VGQDENLSGAEVEGKDRGGDEDGDENQSEDVEVPSIYSSRWNK